MALPTVADVNVQVRSIVSDPTPDYLSDAILLPLIQRAYRKAARVLRAAGVGLLRKDSADISVPASTVVLERTSGVQYPSDLLRPLVLREKTTGGTTFTQMSQNHEEFFYDKTAGTLREIWDWWGDQIHIPAASAASTIVIRYEAELPALTGNSSTILIPDGLDAVSLLTACYAAQARDEQTTSGRFMEMALDDLQTIAQAEGGARPARGATFGRQ